MKVRPVLVTTSSIVMYRVVVAAYGDGAAYGSYWVGAPDWPGAPYGWAGVAHGAGCWRPFPSGPNRLKAGLLLGIVISLRELVGPWSPRCCTPRVQVNARRCSVVPACRGMTRPGVTGGGSASSSRARPVGPPELPGSGGRRAEPPRRAGRTR